MAGSEIPKTMRALVAPKYCWPEDGYEVVELPTPQIRDPKELLFRVHAASIATGETQVARGAVRFLLGKSKMPIRLGVEGAGVVVAVGAEVTAFKPGDEIYTFTVTRPMNLASAGGVCAEYAVTREALAIRKPAHVPFVDMCTLANLVTVVQAADRALEELRANGVEGGLRGKTVFVAGALGALGAPAAQLLKRELGAGRVVASVSTAKVPLVEALLPGVVDRVVDYTRVPRLADAVPRGSVDLVFSTQWGPEGTFALADRERGVVASLAGAPPPALLRAILPPLPAPVYWLAALAQLWYAFCLRGTRVRYFFLSGEPSVRADLVRAVDLLARGTVKALHRVVPLDDIVAIRAEAQKVATGKGGIGKLVIQIV
ncbi:GroES-like protein [Durotheca rogersii]|uniref:GroES-like protein n=1 Tax=Durotheca rogersii TaxID=419775 RepID=UPI00222002DE|nr:GroES-like protein [Durotheca rogersii]KAI5865882.1 GroES-like protein [Durotheca rogersii]